LEWYASIPITGGKKRGLEKADNYRIKS